jgi:hypothetical protein
MNSCDFCFNPLNAELNPICHLLALLGAHHIFHVSGLRVNVMKPKWRLLQAAAVERPAVIHVTGQNYRWLPEVQKAITSKSQRHIVLVAQGEPLCGIVGLVNCIRREQGCDSVRLQLCYFNIFMAVKNTTDYSVFT